MLPGQRSFPSDRLACLIRIEGAAEWRANRADRYPSNKGAAKLLWRLVPEIYALNGSHLHLRIETFVLDDNFSTEVDAVIHAVGVHTFPANGEELLNEILRQLELRCKPPSHLCAVPKNRKSS